MIYKSEKILDKQYNISSSGIGNWKLQEYINGCKRSELIMTTEEKNKFTQRLEDNGWYEYIRS
jgi:hypothetical protein